VTRQNKTFMIDNHGIDPAKGEPPPGQATGNGNVAEREDKPSLVPQDRDEARVIRQASENPTSIKKSNGKRNPLVILFVAVVVALMLFAGFHLARRSGSRSAASSLDANGKMAPDFALQSVDGNTVHLSDFRGKAVLLNFWATWCSPCKIEMPWFVELQQQYGPQGLQVVGVAMDDASTQDIAKFAKDMGVNYPILIGKESVGDAYGGVQFLPTTYFIGRDGKVVGHEFGLKSRSEFEDNIKKALSQGQVQARK
jgi:peroxiredoxin